VRAAPRSERLLAPLALALLLAGCLHARAWSYEESRRIGEVVRFPPAAADAAAAAALPAPHNFSTMPPLPYEPPPQWMTWANSKVKGVRSSGGGASKTSKKSGTGADGSAWAASAAAAAPSGSGSGKKRSKRR